MARQAMAWVSHVACHCLSVCLLSVGVCAGAYKPKGAGRGRRRRTFL